MRMSGKRTGTHPSSTKSQHGSPKSTNSKVFEHIRWHLTMQGALLSPTLCNVRFHRVFAILSSAGTCITFEYSPWKFRSRLSLLLLEYASLLPSRCFLLLFPEHFHLPPCQRFTLSCQCDFSFIRSFLIIHCRLYLFLEVIRYSPSSQSLITFYSQATPCTASFQTLRFSL